MDYVKLLSFLWSFKLVQTHRRNVSRVVFLVPQPSLHVSLISLSLCHITGTVTGTMVMANCLGIRSVQRTENRLRVG